ncbi:cytochrome c [Nibrella saemangeumensis]|uniref:Cytochrome c n=1 Tax=Nibrella saemangeumensis TaxID=1084526 RepID=A0ABP8MLB4_9BACT
MKRKIVRIALGVVGAVALLIIGGVAYVKLMLPDVGPPPEIKIQANAAQIERGKYLAHHVALCIDCHSERDYNRFAAPLVVNSEGKGGEAFLREMGFPGEFYAPNLTPAHLSNWTDGEIYRAITTGVSKDGRALFPLMPYQRFAQMDPEDIKAIIAYMRTLKPIKNEVKAPEFDFPLNFIVNTIPAKTEGGKRPDPTNTVEYGKYLVAFASCIECHTKADAQGQLLPGMEFAGGREFPLPTGTVRTANITPAQTGLANWTKEQFIQKFKSHGEGFVAPAINEGEFNTIMPWSMYAGMTEQDLSAVYDYLRTLKPIENKVEKFTTRPAPVASR